MSDKRKFALIGAGGYIAPRHMQAINETGNELAVALDKHDSVGILDRYSPDADFFVEFERFDRHVNKLQRQDATRLDYLSICSPNYLHDSHARFGLKNGMDVICEKPLVLNPWNAEALQEIEQETNKKVNVILQLRLHPSIIALKKKIEEGPKDQVYDIDLTYITSRGNWYYISWKGDKNKSGGIATNIGVHFFDMLQWIFGDVHENVVHLSDQDKAAGFLRLDRARVRWFLSANAQCLPQSAVATGKRTYRSLTIDNEEIEFSDGFEDLHVQSYRQILSGQGFSIADAMPAIEIVYGVRTATAVGLKGEHHSMCQQAQNVSVFCS